MVSKRVLQDVVGDRFLTTGTAVNKVLDGMGLPRYLECKVRAFRSYTFAAVQKYLQNGGFAAMMLHGCSPSFAWVGVLLVYSGT